MSFMIRSSFPESGGCTQDKQATSHRSLQRAIEAKGSSISLVIWVQLVVFVVSAVDMHVDSSRFSCCCRKPNECLGQSMQDSGLECGLQATNPNRACYSTAQAKQVLQVHHSGCLRAMKFLNLCSKKVTASPLQQFSFHCTISFQGCEKV